MDAPSDTTVDNIVYKTLDTLDDEFDAMGRSQTTKTGSSAKARPRTSGLIAQTHTKNYRTM